MHSKTYFFNEQPIEFVDWGVILINATQMAKPFMNNPEDWVKLPKAIELMDELIRETEFALFNGYQFINIIRKSEDGSQTKELYLYEDLAFEYAEELSVELVEWLLDSREDFRKL
jgi:hypothetical protein